MELILNMTIAVFCANSVYRDSSFMDNKVCT